MKYLILLLCLNAHSADMLVINHEGKQEYLEGIYSYDGQVLYKGKLTEAQKNAVGALEVTNSGIFINQSELANLNELKQQKKDAEAKKIKDKKDALKRLKDSNNQEIKDLLEVLNVR